MLCFFRIVPPPPPVLEGKQQRSQMDHGIYMATNLPDSTRVWNCEVNAEKLGGNGNIEHLRESMSDDGELMKPGHVYWVSDKAPIENLIMKDMTMTQFFRITTSEVGFWFKDHYTANPLGVLPDPNVTDIVAGNKFSEEKLKLVHDWKEEGYKQMNRIEIEKRIVWNVGNSFFTLMDQIRAPTTAPSA